METNKKQLHITFLGTGTSQGIPMIANNHPVCISKDIKDKRLRSSILISWDDVSYTVDCGLDFRQQMLRENVQSLNGVFFTHEHADHIGGLDDLRAFCYKIGDMPIYLIQRTLSNLEQRFDYIFSKVNRYPGAPSVKPFVIDKEPFVVSNLKVIPIKVNHGKLPIVAYRFNDFAYLTDVKFISDEEKQKILNLDVLVVNALRIDEHPTHFNLQEALDLIEEIKPKKAYLTHISHMLGFHEEVSKALPENVFLAYDGLKITV
ncbi:MBL fold metallo-hydrolase [Polaribacter sargassicola]|uniref:MBL fold metallo-hydrolase n=1 Tax=Polaribacter sargassicola TaxID=2836891 RepID=UPI001F3A8215|nr:MBL fold metallo-hydrolase [Polaribacter sp. DS7-9]MCG1036312.1 MBL fold metallo-hydrolase [Polaribacter sp. DS7-9]